MTIATNMPVMKESGLRMVVFMVFRLLMVLMKKELFGNPLIDTKIFFSCGIV